MELAAGWGLIELDSEGLGHSALDRKYQRSREGGLYVDYCLVGTWNLEGR